MGEKKRAENPLLYIHQPNIQTPKASMQSHYMTPKKERDNQQTGYPKRKTRPANRNYGHQQDDDNETGDNDRTGNDETGDEDNDTRDDTEYPEENYERKDGGEEERKKFKDMTFEERIDYFLNRPKYAPAMRCEVKTDGRSYRGAIIDYQEDTVYMRTGNRTKPTEVPFETINDIRLLGF